MTLFRRISIKQRLIINAAIITIGMLLIASSTIIKLESAHLLEQTTKDVARLERDILMLRRSEKDFLARFDMKYFDAFNKNIAHLNEDAKQVKEELESINFDRSELALLLETIKGYESAFVELVDKQQAIGLTPRTGLYGQARDSAHEIEKLVYEQSNYQLHIALLQLRRNEKDFLQRKELKYVDRFSENMSVFKTTLGASNISSDINQKIERLADNYNTAFMNVVDAQKTIGLDHTSGLLGTLRKAIHQSEEQLANLLEHTEDYSTQKRQEITTTLISIIIFITCISVLTLFMTSHSIITPIRAARGTLRSIRESNDLRMTIDVEGNDEISELCDNINGLLSEFHTLVNTTSTTVNNLDQVSNTLSENTQSTGRHLEQQRKESDLVATAATEMQASIHEVSSNTHHAARTAEATNTNAQAGKQEVVSTVQRIRALSEQITQATQLVSELEKDSQTIGSVLDVIRGIAEQTNLLALNAAIEAARAGEQGRGFAVVADEVRNLAMRTQESTQEIESIISSLQNRTVSIVETMNKCREDGLQSVSQINHAGELLEKITMEVSNILDMNTQIAAAVEEQSTVSEEIGTNVVRIRDLAEASSADGQINAQQSTEVSNLSRSLQSDISKYLI